jgi:hypothetical protein
MNDAKSRQLESHAKIISPRTGIADLDFQLRALGSSAGRWCGHKDSPRK